MRAAIPRRHFLAIAASGAAMADAQVPRTAKLTDLRSTDLHRKDLRIHYESYGAGPEALVFVHGWACDLTFWRGQEPLYTDPTRRALLIDLPGHGLSDKPHRAYPIEF
ncbi:MAG: hypothetical protein M3N41_11995, partial [Acidobacteriota bacterium]|nr:hypothetical protein [Acidobacteriota bacterium]